MRIVIVQHDLSQLGGSDRVAVEVGDGLARRGHEVIFAAARFDVAVRYPKLHGKIVFRSALPAVRIGGRFRAYSAGFGTFSSLAKCIPTFAPDAVLFSTQYSLIWFSRWLGRFRAVAYVHWPEKLQAEARGIMWHLYRAPLEAMERKGLLSADAVLCNSSFTAKVLKNLYPVAPRPVYPGVDTNLFQPADPDRTDETLILCVSRFDRSKNLELGIDALAILNRERSQARLIVAGSLAGENKAYYEELREYVQMRTLQDNVEFQLNLSEAGLLDLYQRCAVSVYPPWGEHFGLGPVEAMACGKPVLVCDYGGPTETVVNSVTGFVLPRNPSAWAEKIRLLLTDGGMRRRMGQAARRHVLEKFTLDRTIGEIEEALRGES